MAALPGRTRAAVLKAASRRRAVRRVPDAEFRRLYALGLSDTSLARRLGCDRHAVHNRRVRMGLPLNDGRLPRGLLAAAEIERRLSPLWDALAGRGWPDAVSHAEADVLD